MKPNHIEIVCRKRRSFRDLSREFLRSEMQRHFLTDLLLFAILFAVSAWPVFWLAEAISTFMK